MDFASLLNVPKILEAVETAFRKRSHYRLGMAGDGEANIETSRMHATVAAFWHDAAEMVKEARLSK